MVWLLLNTLVFTSACSRKAEAPAASVAPAKHEHHAPHGGTPVVLGDEVYHLELVLDPVEGKLQAFVLDGEMENFVRSATPAFEVIATVAGEKRILMFTAVADPATGEKVGDTSLFEATADWLKTIKEFDAVLTSIEIRGGAFSGVVFNFPKGNDHDEPPGASGESHADSGEHKKAHKPHPSPRGGTLVQIGKHQFNIDLVLDSAAGKLQGFVVGPHAKGVTDVVRSSMASFEVIATVDGAKKSLVFRPVAVAATGEKPGDSSLFEAHADWLKTTQEFDGVFARLEIGGASFEDVAFKFPREREAE